MVSRAIPVLSPRRRECAKAPDYRIPWGSPFSGLPGERALQQEFGLAPVTIRKAIHALRDEGLVRTTPGWGTYVVKPEDRDK
jgi:DNA-binding transcriptional MocR family regulator